MNDKIMMEVGKLKTEANFTTQATLTQTVIPMQATPTFSQGPINVETALDPYMLSAAFSDALAGTAAQEQTALALDKATINTLASAIADAMRVQTRQGVSSLG
jgi:hypothetical protein